MARHLREVAIDDLIDIGGEMAEELAERAEGTDGEAHYLRELIARWTNAVMVIHHEEESE